jgi:hypothetical protein
VTKPIVLIAEELSPATVEALGPDFEIRECDGADRTALLAAIVDVDAILVRSATWMMSACCKSDLEGADSAQANSSLSNAGSTACPVHLRCELCSTLRRSSSAPGWPAGAWIASPKRVWVALAMRCASVTIS